ncbi:MAG: LysM peptidoglycan-binding domain-containing protein [Candidatus Portnoybacteria bacterium]|nr:LysM peptidoglycan-binding domain-containing protein [Candidatus Portnoybacteria bacterium]
MLRKLSFGRAVAIIFIVFVCVTLTQTIADSFGTYPVDEETEIIRRGSFVYASEYLNSNETIIEEVYVNEGYFETSNVLLGSAYISTHSPSGELPYLGKERSAKITYTVKPGDVPSKIAALFGISTNTLLWANDLGSWDYIKPGQELVILPVSGISYTVKSGDTLQGIVDKYHGDFEETIEFNGLPADGELAVGQEIIIPNGEKPVYYYPTRTYATANTFPRPYSNQSHQFPWGQCTWYVAQRRYIPWSGHAKTWIYKAPRYGFATGSEPRPGAVIATREHPYYGHVAYVESVNGPYVTISEMHLGYGIKKVRTLHKDDWRIIGYIY